MADCAPEDGASAPPRQVLPTGVFVPRTAEDVQTVALYVSASMEGSTPFLGFGKPWAEKMPQITAIAEEALLTLAKSITPQQIARKP